MYLFAVSIYLKAPAYLPDGLKDLSEYLLRTEKSSGAIEWQGSAITP